MVEIPLQSVGNQTLDTVLDGQNCSLSLSYKPAQGLFASFTVNGVSVLTSRLVRTGAALIGATHLGFAGELILVDALGTSDPVYSGLGQRWRLLYLTADEVATYAG